MNDNPFKAPVEPSMTFRDHCAVAAMQGMVTGVVTRGVKLSENSYREIVESAYEVADAMIEARDARRGAQ